MAFAFTCPGCNKTLRTGKSVPMGKSVTCPKCGDEFTMEEDLVVDEMAGEEEAPAKPSAKKKAKAAPEPEEDDDEDDEEEEEKPKKKKKPVVVGGPKKKKKKKKKSDVYVLAGIIVGAMVMFGGFAYMVYFMTMRTNLDVAMLAYAPQDSDSFMSFDFDDLRSNDKVKTEIANSMTSILGANAQKLKDAGFKEDDVSRIVMIGQTKGQAGLIGIRFTRDVELDKLGTAMGYKKIDINGRVGYRFEKDTDKDKGVMVQPAKDLIVMTNESIVNKITDKGAKININEDMMKVVKEGWGQSAFFSGKVTPEQVKAFSWEGSKLPTMRYAGLGMRVGIDNIDFRISMLTTAEAAKEYAKSKPMDENSKSQLQGRSSALNLVMPGLGNFMNGVLETMQGSASGEFAIITFYQETQKVLQMVSTVRGMSGGGGGRPGGGPTGPPGGSGGPKGGPTIIPSGGAAGGVVIPN
jgi:hypothetical protein